MQGLCDVRMLGALEKQENSKQKATLVVKKAESAGSTITLTDRSPLRVSNTDYEPFLSQGLLSLGGEENHPQSICILETLEPVSHYYWKVFYR